jgi:hypothetical protein
MFVIDLLNQSRFGGFIIMENLSRFGKGLLILLFYLCVMRIISFRTLREFWEKPEFADSEASLLSWYHDAKNSE